MVRKRPISDIQIFHALIFLKVSKVNKHDETAFKHISEITFLGC